MNDALFRRLLWIAAAFNVFGAVLFAFPAAPPGQLLQLPADVPLTYRAVTALFVLQFAGSYVWLALQPRIDRPLVGFAAIGKSVFFALVVVLWALHELSAMTVATASGDLVFAGLFLLWLRRSGAPTA